MCKLKLVFAVFIFSIFISYSQCAMCRVVAESSQAGGGTVANSLNTGILYLMAFPYLLILFALISLYFRQKKLQ